ncbi:3'(2'),5'-bisphosphate nucleotidase CysQ family protein [Acinetobacter zhairhuonensis]|uniref:3'(2'),5'-bisphosphate nucleotidase CysQ family protein n=1 Tax=Acinetobacter sp. A7.4 TaxID=2919921 RepID=UPI001F4E09A9|nr:3'(2'),5'-bisphosphate nucleotidase CysQ [Acinetobacter sp. A7.4]MCJ8160676.1 3'(2'),5'-bisphosphate nucleotidase CysQ [Acinetobacter sp. A7.4]
MFIKTDVPQDEMILKLVPMMTQACEILNQEFQQYCSGEHFNIEHKHDDSPVTQADFRANQFITQALANISPDIPLLSEEGDYSLRQQWQRFWLLDPLDGTKEFLHQRPEFTINLSLVDGAQTIFAILAIPGEQSMYICPFEGMPLKLDFKTQQWFIYTPEQQQADTVKVGLSPSSQQKGHYHEYLQVLESITEYSVFKAGSAYKFCMMLEHKIDIYPRFHPTSEWDTSAGQCLLERIGGGLVDFKGRPFLYNQRDSLLNKGFIAYRTAEMQVLALDVLARMLSKH